MEEAIVYASIIGGIFSIIALELMSRNWFKKRGFEFNISSLKKQQDLYFKQMQKQFGLQHKNAPIPQQSSQAAPSNDGIGSLLNLAKNLNPDQLAAIGDIIQGRLVGGEGDGEIIPEGIEGLLDFAEKNPDIAQKFLGGLGKGMQEKQSGVDDENSYLG